MDNSKYTSLGCMNSWEKRVWTLSDGSKKVEKEDTTPMEYTKCVMSGHNHKQTKLGECLYSYYCPICNIGYTVDSSD
jgi:hypothetical protein